MSSASLAVHRSGGLSGLHRSAPAIEAGGPSFIDYLRMNLFDAKHPGTHRRCTALKDGRQVIYGAAHIAAHLKKNWQHLKAVGTNTLGVQLNWYAVHELGWEPRLHFTNGRKKFATTSAPKTVKRVQRVLREQLGPVASQAKIREIATAIVEQCIKTESITLQVLA